MDESESKDTYVSQLKEVFDSCDTTGSGCLNETELHNLCEKLHLAEHANFLVHHLLESDFEVKFEDFKECFVAILTQAIPNDEVTESCKSDDVADREVSPKFTLGRKKYGRRSRPASIVDDDSSMTSSPILSPQTSIDQTSSSTDRISKASPGNENVPGKRPVSPSNVQQPPMKSGRMTNEPKSCSQDDGNSSQHTSDSEVDLNHSFESNPVQYLQETWKKLGIGKNGYLNVEELALVCEHIGMDMTEEVVAQLFEKLDCDQDGQISFDEFLQGLFQHGEPESCESPVLKSNPSKSVYNDGSRDDHEISNSCISGIFSCIDLNNTGYADASTILELWESLELPCSPQLLEELGFNTNMKINLADLTSVLEEVLINVLNKPLLQLAFLSFQNEMQYLRQTIDQMQKERNKLRINVEEANTRAALLAQEVDDNHAKLENSLQKKLKMMEKKYQDQARELVEELQQERDAINSQSNKLKQQLQADIAAAREEESKLKSRLSLLEQENSRLEQELLEATEKYIEAEKLNEVLQKELSVIPDLKAKLAELESNLSELQDRNTQMLMQELETCKKTNQGLQDKIDELTLEMESMHQNSNIDTASNKGVSRTHSWLSDYKKASFVGYKRRGSGSSSDDNSEDESPSVEKIRKTYLSGSKTFLEPDIQNIQNGAKLNASLKGNQPSSVDILLKDMLLDQTHLMQKLQVAEEKRVKMERAYRRAEQKIKILSRLLSMSTVSEATAVS